MSGRSAPLERLGARIECLTVDPDSISAPFTRLLRPLLYRIGWRPRASVEAVRTLVDQLDRVRQGHDDGTDRAGLLVEAMDELEDNLRQVERATVVNRRPLVAHAAWLRRLYEILTHADRAVTDIGNRSALALASMPDEALMLPPLTMGDAKAATAEQGAGAGAEPGEDEAPRADPTRVLELQLDTIDHLMAAAREEDALLGRRRRLLDAARQMLLETSAALSLDEDGVQQRLQNIAKQITRINRHTAAGLKPDVALMHQARRALSRGERDKLFAVLSVLRRRAADTGDSSVAAMTTAAVDRLLSRPPTPGQDQASLDRSAEELLGDRVVKAVYAGYQEARAATPESTGNPSYDKIIADAVTDYFAPGRERAMLSHALSVDGCFDVGGVLSPVRIEEAYLRHRVVAYPTQRLKLVPATGPQHVPAAVIHDPRSIIMDLAAGRLLARRFVKDEVATRPRIVMQGEIRVYVLDGSSSMLGPRAQMRDAILVAELATLLRRLENPRQSTRVVLYYRYFTKELGPVSRVDTPGGAIEAIRRVTSKARTGSTDIEGALLASMKLIGEAQADDPDLARAQIVLITDGDAHVDEAQIIAARQTIGELPVGISVIALGEENEALREIVAHQRAKSERAFYHYLPDRYLTRLSQGQIDDELAVHLPPVPRAEQTSLQEELGALLDELVELQRSREAEALRDLDRVDRERRIERPDLDTVGEGERARLEALYRDELALTRRYERWFPRPAEPGEGPPSTALAHVAPQDGTLERDDLDSVLVVLTTIAEVVETVGSARLGRQADAVDLLERLLPNARLSAARYHEVLRLYPNEVAAALEAVHGSAQHGLGWRISNLARHQAQASAAPRR